MQQKFKIMKIFGIILINLIFAFSIQDQDSIQLTVTIDGISSDKGKIYIGLYDKSGWLKNRLKGEKTDIKNGEAMVVFNELPSGKYGISAYHDENENGKMDTNFLHIPTEDYACSRGAVGRFGPPSWDDAVFQLTETDTIDIQF